MASTKPFRSLRYTLAVAFVLVSILALTLSTGLELYFGFQTQHRIVLQQQQTAAQTAASKVQEFVQEKIRQLDQSEGVNDLAEDPSRRDTVLGKMLGIEPSFRQIALLDENGAEISRASRVSALTPDPLAQIPPELLSETRAGRIYTSPVYIDSRTNEPLMLIGVPLLNAYGDWRGAYAAEVNLKFMWDLVASIHAGQAGSAYVVDRQGNLIAIADTSRVLKRENIKTVPEVAEFMVSARDTVQTAPVRGVNGSYVISGFASLATPDWAVVVEIPLLEAYAPLIREAGFATGALLLSIAFALMIGAFLARRMTREITLLGVAADRISTGDMKTAINISDFNRNTEIGHLAEAFNTMIVRLRSVYEGLDAAVKEKTDQLSSQVSEVEKSRLAILNLLEDIDREKNAAEQLVVERTKELRNEKARLLASINSLSFGFVIADTNGVILLKNPALGAILETADDAATLNDIAPRFEGIDLIASCKECIQANSVVEHKNVVYGKKFLRVFCAPVTDGAAAIGNVVLIEDITEAKVLERSRDEFFAVASHELRTPLTAIRGNADMILEMYADKIVDRDMKEMLDDINSSSVRLIDIVNDFLEVSRLEQGRFEMKKEQFDLGEVIDRTVRNLRPVIEKKGLGLAYTPPNPPLPAVTADKARVEQILVNLLGNAMKFSKQGSISIETAVMGGFVKISVTDTGIGISEQNQSLLFHKFQQAGEKMLARDITQGTGLGLYICKLIVGNMGGTIALERSELGKGSTFAFTVPIAGGV